MIHTFCDTEEEMTLTKILAENKATVTFDMSKVLSPKYIDFITCDNSAVKTADITKEDESAEELLKRMMKGYPTERGFHHSISTFNPIFDL